MISREACAEVALAAGLGDLLVARAEALGAEHAEHLASQRRVLGALAESVLGAGFVALGYDRTAAACVEAFTPRIDWVLTAPVEPKTLLQEEAQRLGRSLEYALVDATGPAHDRSFTFAVVVDGAERGRGSGSSKKAAQAAAALAALDALAAPSAEAPPCT